VQLGSNTGLIDPLQPEHASSATDELCTLKVKYASVDTPTFEGLPPARRFHPRLLRPTNRQRTREYDFL
jgi:hypothetical protein